MAKRFDIIGVDDDKAKDIAEIMNNKTSKKILDHLKEKTSTETEISKELGLPNSTVNYNIQKLLKSGLIDIERAYWSPKGNKVNVYKASKKVFVFTPHKTPYLETKLRSFLPVALVALIIALVVINLSYFGVPGGTPNGLKTFGNDIPGLDSCNALENAFREARWDSGGGSTGGIFGYGTVESQGRLTGGEVSSNSLDSGKDYSETNIQVEGVDEADIVKTDGKYIYVLTRDKMIIAEAYPSENAKIISETLLEDFTPTEIFIDKDRLLVFGRDNKAIVSYGIVKEESYNEKTSVTTVQIYDTKDKSNPELLKTWEFEGDYFTARKINSDVYFVLRSFSNYYEESKPLVPAYREDLNGDYSPIVDCGDVSYFEPMNARNIISVISVSMQNPNREINKEVIVGSGNNIYASSDNLYLAESNGLNTNVHKFSLDNGKIKYTRYANVRGTVLNQFSMDEYEGNFRIATTTRKNENNVYVYNEKLDLIGKLENLAEGERIYSARFMGDRGYLVTFKQVDPLYVFDLSNPENPQVLGELKIPGYSDYLHPYDENHLIGIGRDTEEVGNGVLFQGLKIALFDITDVNNPKELYTEIIGERSTDSEALRDHKAFLFDNDKNLLVIPIRLDDFEGSYVYELTIEDGFNLRGKVEQRAAKRNLFIENVLYGISESKIVITSLENLEKIKDLIL